MKFLALIFFSFLGIFSHAQQKEFWLIDSENSNRKIVKDSISAARFLDSLSQNHYYLAELKEVRLEGTKTLIYYDKGKNYNQAFVKLSPEITGQISNGEQFYTKNLDSLKLTISEKFRNKGFSFNRVKSKFLGFKNDIPEIEISILKGNERKIDGFVIKGYDKIPKRFVKNLEKEYKGKTYDDKNLLEIYQSLQNHPFLTLEKTPQTLFTKDSTQVYLFFRKKKTNTFDGIIGFGNDKTEKLSFNGTLNANFRNIFNGFETLGLFWQRTPDKGQTFDLQSDIPYLFSSNLGGNINVNIFRQDSTFATVKFRPAVYYHISERQRIGLRGTLETSSIINDLYSEGKDFNKKGVGLWYEYVEPSEVELFLYKSRLSVETNLFKVNYTTSNSNANQKSYFLSGERNFQIKGNNYLNLSGQSALISSTSDFSASELLRFGGWNSLRGFNEDSLVGDFYAFGSAEYRYLVKAQAFFDIFGQYAQVHNKNLQQNSKLYSFGLGFNLFLPIGLMSFQISNGNEFGSPIKVNDTKIHWGILTRF